MKKLIKSMMTFFLSFMLLNLQVHSLDGSIVIELGQRVQAQNVVTDQNSQGQTGYLQLEGDDSSGMMSKLASPGVALLVYMASAFVIYKLIMACKPVTYDVIGAAIAAGIYIMGEVMSITTGEQKLKAKTLEYKTYSEDEVVSSEQYEVLVQEKTALMEIKQAAEKRQKMQNAAALAFGVSAGIAVFTDVKSKSLATVCTAKSGAAAMCGASCSVPLKVVSAKELSEAEYFSSPFHQSKLYSMEDAIATATGSCIAESAGVGLATAGACQAASFLADSSCKMYVLNEKLGEIACVPISLADETPKTKVQKWYANIFENVVNQKANASGGKLLSAIAGAIGGYVLVESGKIDMLISAPTKRAILWGGLAVFGKMVAGKTGETISKVDRNIAMIDQILDKMNATMEKGIDVSVGSVASNVTGTGSNVTTFPSGPLGAVTDCLNGSSGSGCNSLPNPKVIPDLESKFPSIPQGLKSSFNDMLGFANGVQGRSSISPKAASKIDSLNGRQNAINKSLLRGQKRLDKVRKKLGKDNFKLGDKAKSNFLDRVKKASDYFKKKGMNPNSMLSKIGGSASGFASSGTGRDSGLSDAQKAAGLLGDDLEGGKGLGDSLGGKGLDGANAGTGNGEFNFEFDEDALEAEVAAKNAAFADMAAEASKIEGSEEDSIIEDPTVSIWKVLSTRYLKSGYKKLLEEVKE